MTKRAKKTAKKTAPKSAAPDELPPGYEPLTERVGPNVHGLRRQTAIMQQPDEEARAAVISEFESNPEA